METSTGAAPSRNRFDTEARERIRRALLRYMRDHRIGVPRLQKEIATANDLSLDRVPLKTLQRFLGNTHRSNEAMVRFCHQFVASLIEDDPLDRFGEELAAFHAAPSADARALEPYAGAFEGLGLVRPQGLAVHDPQKTTKVSTLRLTPRAASPFLRADEAVSNWRNEAAPQGDTRRTYEGVAVLTSAGLLVALRNALTGGPRTYWLTPGTDGLAGQGAEPIGPLDREPPSAFDGVALETRIFRRMEGQSLG